MPETSVVIVAVPASVVAEAVVAQLTEPVITLDVSLFRYPVMVEAKVGLAAP